MAMRNQFQNELMDLHNDLLRMGSVVEKTIELMIESLTFRNPVLLQEIVKRDDIVDQYEAEIEKKCLYMMLRQQPVAVDLRSITSILKMITDIERIADQSSDIAEYLIKLTKWNGETVNTDLTDVIQMAETVKQMVGDTIECYVKLDEKRAIAIAKEDDLIDQYFEEIEKRLEEEMKQNSSFITEGICYIQIIKYLERMADHTTNICEWIAYRVTGKHIQYN